MIFESLIIPAPDQHEYSKPVYGCEEHGVERIYIFDTSTDLDKTTDDAFLGR